jgi:hypothetical protein
MRGLSVERDLPPIGVPASFIKVLGLFIEARDIYCPRWHITFSPLARKGVATMDGNLKAIKK